MLGEEEGGHGRCCVAERCVIACDHSFSLRLHSQYMSFRWCSNVIGTEAFDVIRLNPCARSQYPFPFFLTGRASALVVLSPVDERCLFHSFPRARIIRAWQLASDHDPFSKKNKNIRISQTKNDAATAAEQGAFSALRVLRRRALLGRSRDSMLMVNLFMLGNRPRGWSLVHQSCVNAIAHHCFSPNVSPSFLFPALPFL